MVDKAHCLRDCTLDFSMSECQPSEQGAWLNLHGAPFIPAGGQWVGKTPRPSHTRLVAPRAYDHEHGARDRNASFNRLTHYQKRETPSTRRGPRLSRLGCHEERLVALSLSATSRWIFPFWC